MGGWRRMPETAWVLGLGLAIIAIAPGASAQQAWSDYLRRDAVENIQISPSGKHLALAERHDDGTVVVIRDTATLLVQGMVDPGNHGEISDLKWLDDDRLLVGANRADTRYQVALVEPAMYIVNRNDNSRYRLPANFVATIDGDSAHLLVSTCGHWEDGGCVPAIHRAEIGHLSRLGDPLISAPDTHSTLWTDQQGHVRFAVAWDDRSDSKLWVHRDGHAPWTLVNDSSESGIDSLPLGMDRSGMQAYLATERKSGVGVIERYDIASGQRTEVYRDKTSDPLWPIYAFDGNTPVGAWYDATRPRAVIWNQAHPDVPAFLQILNAFPGDIVTVVSASADRNLAIVLVGNDRDPGAFYLFDRTARTASLIARKRPWLESMPKPSSRGVQFEARDGLTLHALLTLPAGSGPRPLVVIPHGGPYEFIDTWGYDAEATLLASRGYAVLRVNFRGSGGYGRDFVERGYREWGRAMQDDLTDATRWVVSQGLADASRICIYGASYGGYAALMGAVREPALYRCAASYAAPTDLSKMYKWGSIRRSDLGMHYLERVLGTDREELAHRSPAQQVASIRIPVLLGHGKLDGRVDDKHVRLLARNMRKQGLSPELVEYPYEGHGLAIAQDQIDFYGRLLRFLDAHIGPDYEPARNPDAPR